MTYTDIIFPNNNEDEFLKIAKALGYTKLIFAYKLNSTKKEEIKNQTLEILKQKTKLIKLTDLVVETAIIINESDYKSLNNQNLNIIKDKDNLIFFDASSVSDLRVPAKNKSIDMIFGAELNKNKDFMHQRNSGLDEVICKIAKESKTAIGFSLNYITDVKNKRIIGRTAQSLMLTKKKKCQIKLFSFARKNFELKSPKDIISLFFLIGLDKKKSRLAMKGFK